MSKAHPLWRRLDLRRPDGTTYLHRRGIQTRWFNAYLHRIDSPDPGRALHNHPWWFGSLILRGGYVEEFKGDAGYQMRRWRRGTWHTVPLRAFHRIVKVEPGTVTLIITGPYRQKWGFDAPDGFVPHGEYRFAGLNSQDNEG